MFFIAAYVELCFWFVTEWYWEHTSVWDLADQPCTASGLSPFLSVPPALSLHCPLASRLEEKEAGEGHSQEICPQLTRDIPYHIMSCSALKKKGGWSSKVVIAQRLAGHRSAQGGWWVIAFASLRFFSFLHSLNSLHLDLWILLFLCFPCPTGSWVGPDLLTGSTHCKHAGKLTTFRETGSPNQHGVRLDYGFDYVYLPFDCVYSLAEDCFLDGSLQKFLKELLNQTVEVVNLWGNIVNDSAYGFRNSTEWEPRVRWLNSLADCIA